VVVGESPSVRGELGLLAAARFARGEVIVIVDGLKTWTRTRYTFQVSPTEHIEPREPDGERGVGHFLNHSCDPNAGVRIVAEDDSVRVEVVARREILPTQEVTLDYAAMEYDTAAREIDCQCGVSICRGKLRGYKDLPQHLRGQYRGEGLIPDYLLQME
jgi:hypothetical protein